MPITVENGVNRHGSGYALLSGVTKQILAWTPRQKDVIQFSQKFKITYASLVNIGGNADPGLFQFPHKIPLLYSGHHNYS